MRYALFISLKVSSICRYAEAFFLPTVPSRQGAFDHSSALLLLPEDLVPWPKAAVLSVMLSPSIKQYICLSSQAVKQTSKVSRKADEAINNDQGSYCRHKWACPTSCPFHRKQHIAPIHYTFETCKLNRAVYSFPLAQVFSLTLATSSLMLD